MTHAPRVVVVGSVNVDLTIRVSRIPRPGETIAGGTLTRSYGGKGANQAAAAARLGANTTLIGMTGDDAAGLESRTDLRGFGVDIDGSLGHSPSSTGTAAVLLSDNGENAIAVASGANHDLTGEFVADAMEALADGPAVVLTNFEVPDDAIVAAADIARQRRWSLVLNPAPARSVPETVVPSVLAITPNEEELRAIGPVDRLLTAGVDNVVVTLGARGADLYLATGERVHVDPYQVDVVDTTGAGDAFNGALAWALATGRDLEDSVRLATVAGALACRSVGARSRLPDATELLTLVGG